VNSSLTKQTKILARAIPTVDGHGISVLIYAPSLSANVKAKKVLKSASICRSCLKNKSAAFYGQRLAQPFAAQLNLGRFGLQRLRSFRPT